MGAAQKESFPFREVFLSTVTTLVGRRENLDGRDQAPLLGITYLDADLRYFSRHGRGQLQGSCDSYSARARDRLPGMDCGDIRNDVAGLNGNALGHVWYQAFRCQGKIPRSQSGC